MTMRPSGRSSMSSLSTGTLSEPAVRVVDEAGGGTDPASPE